jgi:hypothetical protein
MPQPAPPWQALASVLPPASAEAVPDGADDVTMRSVARGSSEDKTATNSNSAGACALLE